MKPKFQLEEIVGFEGELWSIKGIEIHLGYQFNSHQYSLMALNWAKMTENTKCHPKWIPEDKLLSAEKMKIQLKIKKEAEITSLNEQIGLLEKQIKELK